MPAMILYTLAAALLLLLALEGAASILYAVRGVVTVQPLAERLHTEYDADLGWVNLPNVDLPNMYGPGRGLRTNSQRFRGAADFAPRVPAGKRRVVCSGDSFTLGYGVDDASTWPAFFAKRAPHLETVNMGQGGYGLDQAYLWYERDGVKLDHDLQIFTVITNDFQRMQMLSFSGYAKPVLALENGKLVTRNVPVPKRASSPAVARAQSVLAELDLTRLLRRALRRDAPEAATSTQAQRNEETLEIVGAMLDDLAERHRGEGSELVVVYLPTRQDYVGNSADPWRRYLAERTARSGIVYLDLFDDMRRLVPEEKDKLFIAEGAVNFPGATGHYTEAGNEFVANLIYDALMMNPATQPKLQAQ
jgi:hypothetical protein